MMKRKVLLTFITGITGLVAVAAAACGGGGGDTESVPTPAPTVAPATPTSVPEPVVSGGSSNVVDIDPARLSEIQAALGSVLTSESFHFALDASIQASVAGISLDIPVSAAGDFQPPDLSHATLSINMGFVSFEIETVTADGFAYATDPQTGEWTKSADAGGLLSGPHVVIALVLQIADQMHVVGTESIGDVPVLHLRADDALGVLGADPDGSATVDVWVDLDTLTPVRIGVEGEISLSDLGDQFPAQIGGGPAKFAATIIISDYGVPVVIDVPVVETTLVDGRLPGRKVELQIDLVVDFATSHPAYKSTPATSGWHYGPPNAPAKWGVHDDFVIDEVLLQNLVQGGVGLHYSCPDGCPEIVAAFTEVAGLYDKIIVSPYIGMDYKIALTAWTYIDEMDELDLDRLDIFVRAHHNSERAPEHYKP
jgi:hypothetical protein